MRINKFVLYILYCWIMRILFIDVFYLECIFEYDFDLILGINVLNKLLIFVDSFF